jgi:AcrR family transcriptional regulator
MTGPGAGGTGSPVDDPQAVATAITDALLPKREADPIDQIVHTTLEVLAERGTAAVSFDEVASRSGVASSTLDGQFEDVDHLIRFAFERSGEGLRELVESAERPDDAVHLILPALKMHSPYAQAYARVILDGYGLETVQREFPLAQHLVTVLSAQRDEKGAGPIDPRVASAAVMSLAMAWHFNGDFLARAYGLGDLDEVEVRRQLSVTLEAIVGLVTGPRLG